MVALGRAVLIALVFAFRAPVIGPAFGQTPNQQSGLQSRWLDVQAAQVETRYRLIRNSAGKTTVNQWQHKQVLRGALRLDPSGRYTAQALITTGNGFTGSWNDTGVGTGDPGWKPRVRHLYLAAAPMKGLEIQVGGLGLARGESTEITTLDNDGYMVGERVSLRRPDRLFVDELSVTAGYLGDLVEPNVFERLDRLNDHNFTQILVGRRLGARGAFTADWTSLGGTSIVHQAIRIGVPELRLIDRVRFEQYARLEGDEDYGYAVTLEKTVRRVLLSGGSSDVDRNFGGLNGDRYGSGRKLFALANVPLTPVWSIQSFYAHGLATDFPVLTNRRFDLVLTFNALNAFRRNDSRLKAGAAGGGAARRGSR